jgi:hypothetical protein
VIEVSSAGRTAVVEDFAQVTFLTSERQWTQRFRGKGQNEMVSAFLAGIASGQPPIPFDQWAASARATLKLLESASSGLPVWLSLP